MKYKVIISKITAISALFVAAVSISACTASANDQADTENDNVADHSVDITLSDNGSTASSSGITIDGNTLTITNSGTYTFTGTLTDGCIVVNSQDGDVELVLNNCNISSSTGSAIYSLQGDMSIEIPEGSTNTLADATVYSDAFTESGEDACIYGSDRITIKGDGELTVTGNYKDGIAGSDEVKINGSTITISAVNNGIKGKDYVELNGGNVNITSEDDGIKSSDGYIVMNDGTYTLDVIGKGINCETDFTANGGTLTVTAQDDAINANNNCTIENGTFTLSSGDDGIHADNELVINNGVIDVTDCYEGLEGLVVTINDGDIKVNSDDDGINASDGNETSETPTFENRTEDTSSNPSGNSEMPEPPSQESSQNNTDGNPPMGEPPENNMKGNPPERPQSSESQTTDSADTEENFNQRPEHQRPVDGNMGFGAMDVNENCIININGGTVYVNAGGDGIDSNGSINFNGGTVVVSGPDNSGNGALDSGTSIAYNGGTLIAYGSDGMTELPDSSSEGYSVTWYGLNISANTLVSITDESGNVIAAFTPVKNISCLTVGSESMENGDTLTLNTGGSYSGELSDSGFAVSGSITGQSSVSEITISDKVTTTGTRNSGFGKGGGRGRQMPNEDMQSTEQTTVANV